MMPYGASKPGCDMLGNLQTLFLGTQEGHCLPFFWRCAGEAAGDGWSTAHQISALQSFVDGPVRARGCKHCSVKDKGLKHRKQLRAWEMAESNDFQASGVWSHQLIPHNSLSKHSWTTAQFRVVYFQDRLRMCMVRYSSSTDRSHYLSYRSSSN